MSFGTQQQVPVPAVEATEPDKYPYDLGKHARTITTSNPKAQIWFDRGLNWMYGFCHEEALRCFQYAHELDEQSPMVLWGLACASGPHYNFGWDSQSRSMQHMTAQKTHDYTVRAKAACAANKSTAHATTPIEDALIDALQARFPQATAAEKAEEYAAWNAAYADEMQNVYKHTMDDLDVVALFAEAMLNLAPWNMWDVKTGEPKCGPARTLQAKSVLERALRTPQGSQHPGILHMYIHLMEMSPQPEAAVAASNALRGIVPDSGHLQHMASHIDVLVGTYRKGMQSNIEAVDVDRKYLTMAGLTGMYTLYAMHNIMSLVFAAMMAGNLEHTLAGCARLEEITTEAFLRIQDPPWADYGEAAVGMRYHALVRFGRWGDILNIPLPHDPELYCVTTATAHYAKALAQAARGNITAAEKERRSFLDSAERVPESRQHFPNNSRAVLALARCMLDGELEYRKGNFNAAFSHLAGAVHHDDELLYAEPPSWMVPARHAAAALLLEQNRVTRAAEYYAQDLGLDFAEKGPKYAALARARQHPLNPWALKGYHDCLVKLGKNEEAHEVMGKLNQAVAGADVKIPSSCFCAIGHATQGGATSGTGKLAACCL